MTSQALEREQRSWRHVRVGMILFGLLAVGIGIADPQTGDGHKRAGIIDNDTALIRADPIDAVGPPRPLHPPLVDQG